MKELPRWLVTSLVTLALILSATPRSAAAQSPAVSLSTLIIELWPEYDRPAMLVQLSGTLDARVTLPAQVMIRVPAASGGPLAVATRTAAGNLVNAPYTTTVSGDQIVVTLSADTPDFHVEYYDPGLAITGTARSFTFLWNTDYAAASAAIRVQAPVDSSQLTADLPLTPDGPGVYGLNYYTALLGALTAGQQVSLRLTYSKSSSTLSATQVAASSTQPTAPSAAAPALTLGSPWLWAGVSAGLAVFGVALWALGRMRASQEEERRRNSRRRRPVGQPSAGARRTDLPSRSAPGEAAGFCTQCGQRLLEGDRFCRSCGTPVRK